MENKRFLQPFLLEELEIILRKKEQVLQELNGQLRGMRGGSLHVKHRNGRVYYCEYAGGKEIGISKEEDKIYRLARKEYLQKAIRRISEECVILKTMIQKAQKHSSGEKEAEFLHKMTELDCRKVCWSGSSKDFCYLKDCLSPLTYRQRCFEKQKRPFTGRFCRSATVSLVIWKYGTDFFVRRTDPGIYDVTDLLNMQSSFAQFQFFRISCFIQHDVVRTFLLGVWFYADKCDKPLYVLTACDLTHGFNVDHHTRGSCLNDPSVDSQDIALFNRPFERESVNVDTQNILWSAVFCSGSYETGLHQPFSCSAGKQCAVMVQIFRLYQVRNFKNLHSILPFSFLVCYLSYTPFGMNPVYSFFYKKDIENRY